MDDTQLMPGLQVRVLEVVEEVGAICTRHMALRLRLDVPVASRVLNRLADFGIIVYDTTVERWVVCDADA